MKAKCMKQAGAIVLALIMLVTAMPTNFYASEIVPEVPQEMETEEIVPVEESIVEEPADEVISEMDVKTAGTTTGTLGDNDGFTWTYDAASKTLTVTGEDSGLNGDVYSGPLSSLNLEIEKIVYENCIFKERLTSLMYRVTDLKEVEFINCDTSDVTDMSRMFAGCENLTSLDVSKFDTSNVTDMSLMFHSCSGLTSLDVSAFDTSKVTDMSHMFNICSGLRSLDVSAFDTSNVTNMYSIFGGCSDLTSLDVSSLDTTNVTNMAQMFWYCSSLTSLNVSSLDTSKVTDMSYMFGGCSGLTSLDVSAFDTSKATDMSGMFNSCSGLKSLDVSGLDTTNVTNMNCMFGGCSGLTSLDLSSFDMSNLLSYSINYGAAAMLDGCSNLSKIYSPKKLAADIYIDLPGTFYDPDENSVTQIISAHCNKILTRNEFIIPVPAEPYKIANVVSGVHVYWKAPEGGASKYGLWRSETGINGTYKWVANPSVPHFTDTKVESGKTYHYRVTVLDTKTNKHGDKSEAIGIVYTSTPDITSRINKAAGIQLGWQKVPGATGYAIYRKSYSGNDAWKRIATITDLSKLTYVDESIKGNNGTIYKYTIRALAGNDKKTLSGCRNAGRTMVRLSSRVLNSVAKASKTSIKASWSTSSAVTGYEVRFMVGDKVEKTFTVGNCKTGTKTFTGLKAGKTYKVQVRAYKKVDGVGSFYSAWSTAKNVTLP